MCWWLAAWPFGGWPSRAARAARVAPWPCSAWQAVLAVVALIGLIIVDGRGNSVYRLLWELLPGFDTLRSPFRIQLVLYPLAIFVVIAALEAWSLRRPRRGSVEGDRTRRARIWSAGRLALSVVLLSGILIEMQRNTEQSWTSADLAPAALVTQVPAVRSSCESFVLDSTGELAGTPDWKLAIDAVIISMLSDVPTADGYSRGTPVGHPDFGARPESLIRWMRSVGYTGGVCIVSPSGIDVATT